MRMRLLPICTLIIIVLVVNPAHPERHEVVLDDKYVLGWEVNQGNSTIEIDATGETQGYIGIGLSTRGKMDKAEMAIGGIHQTNGKSYHGIYTAHHHKVKLDKKRKWTLLEARQNETHTFVKYSRPLTSSSYIPIQDKDIYVIWALGKSDKIKKHHGHGKYQVNLINPTDENLLTDFNEISMDFSFII